MPFRNRLLLPAAVLGVLTLAGCATTPAATAPSASPATGDGHGYVAGAEEVAEPQLHLLTVDAAGAVDMLDLVTEEPERVASLDGVTSTVSDGRYLFASAAEAGTVTVLDSGVWTWDHVDHFHYYRGQAAVLGTVEGTGPAATSVGSTGAGVFFAESGEAVLLDAGALGDGEVREVFRVEVEPHDGWIIPFADGALVTVADAAGRPAAVQALDAEGESVGSATECPAAGRPLTTVVGVAFPCADGAVLVTDDDGEPVVERIAYPAGTTAPAASAFAARENRPTVAALAGDQGVWLLDTRERSWQLLPTATPLVRVTAVDDADGHVLGLTADGRVSVISARTGGTLATTEPLAAASLADPALAAGVELVTDAGRAYLNAPAEQRLYELDFADAGRISRTFETPGQPVFFAEVGR